MAFQDSATGTHDPVILRAMHAWGLDTMPARALAVIAGTALLALSAKVQVPFYPVPMSMQTFVVLGLGFTLGARLAGLTLLLYLAQGALGLPVFAGAPEKGVGLAYMVGPTGGYLFGFLIAAVACGLLAERGWGRSVVTTAAGMLIGNILIYAAGLSWLGMMAGWDKPILEWGLYPFISGDLAKLALATALLPAACKLVDKCGPMR